MKRWTSEEIELAVRLGAPLHTRIRRGKLVIIPEKWVGHTTSQQTVRKRQSKFTRKLRMFGDWGRKSTRAAPRRPRDRDIQHVTSWKKTGSHPNNWAPRLTPHKFRHDDGEGWE